MEIILSNLLYLTQIVLQKSLYTSQSQEEQYQSLQAIDIINFQQESLIKVIMEDSDSSCFPPNTASSMIRKPFESARPTILRKTAMNESDSLPFTADDMSGQKKIKSIILNKRRHQSNNIEVMEPFEASTDNEDEKYTNLTKSLATKHQNSHILKDFQVLHGFFDFEAQFRLLFRASDHHFSVQKFHELCDYQTNTLTLCKTKSNQVIGGYTPLNWAENYQDSKTYFKTDKDNETFLFSASKNQKFPLTKSKKNKAICCFRSWGPTFGGGYDLQIGNLADQSSNSVSHFPRSFSCNNKQTTQKYLTGSKNRQFKVLEWQVYKVIKKSSIKLPKQDNIEVIDKTFLQIIKKGFDLMFFSKQNQRKT